MSKSAIGVIWGLAFVLLEATQFVYFGGLFQLMSSFVFGFLVFGIITLVFVGWAAARTPEQLKIAFANPGSLIAVNVCATLAVGAYLMSVQLIEPAAAYTISSGMMPVTAYLAYRFGVREGEPMRNATEALGNLFLFAGVVYLAAVTLSGLSGFVRGDTSVAFMGVALAITDGVLFTWVLIYCQRLNRAGVSPGAVFGLRFPLYVLFTGTIAAVGIGQKAALSTSDIAIFVAFGLALTVPPLYALQKAVSLVSTMTISALTALGPFVIFGLQIIEGRVEYAPATLIGLALYFVGALLTAFGAVKATVGDRGSVTSG